MEDPSAHIYVCRDVEGEIIYIGCSTQVDRRLAEHRYRTTWWHEVTKVDKFPFADADLARKREADAIASVRPTYNIAHVNRDRIGRVRDRGGPRRNGSKFIAPSRPRSAP